MCVCAVRATWCVHRRPRAWTGSLSASVRVAHCTLTHPTLRLVLLRFCVRKTEGSGRGRWLRARRGGDHKTPVSLVLAGVVMARASCPFFYYLRCLWRPALGALLLFPPLCAADIVSRLNQFIPVRRNMCGKLQRAIQKHEAVRSGRWAMGHER